MRRDRTRLVRRALVALLVAVIGAVWWSLRPRGQHPGEAIPQPATSPGQQAVKVGDLVFLRFNEGNRKVELRARASVGQEGSAQRFVGVEVTLPYVAQGRPGTVTISADDCVYQAQPLKATFRGHVRVRTDDGFELETESLRYRSEPVLNIRTEDPLSFRRGKASGTARGMEYREGGGLRLQSQVVLHLAEDAGPATDVESGSASASREEALIWFENGVAVHQGSRELRAQRLQLKMTADFAAVERAAAIEDVDLRIGSGAPLPGVKQEGEKRIRCRRLNMAFREKGVLQEVSAVNPGILELLPGPGDPPERRRISGKVLRFLFDPEGRLTSLDAESAGENGPPEQRRVVLVSEPLARSGAMRRVESRTLSTTFDAVSGALQRAEFDGTVAFAEPGRKAWAEHASFDEAAGLLTLRGGEPRVLDEAQGGELRAREIRLGTRSHAVSASEGVRHTIPRKRFAGAGPLGGEEPVVVLCRQFDYDGATRTARYRDNVVMVSGQDEIRAPLIEVAEPGEGERRLSASGGVASVLHPRKAKNATKAPAPVETRSKEMVYEEKTHRVVYTGDVQMRQGDVVMKSPRAEALLTPDGGAVDRVLAGEPVDVRQGARHATGEHGTYTPRDETFVLAGEKVVLLDADRRIEGRIVSFQSGSDRIRVDGRDEVRSEAVFKRKEPLKP